MQRFWTVASAVGSLSIVEKPPRKMREEIKRDEKIWSVHKGKRCLPLFHARAPASLLCAQWDMTSQKWPN
jgi:hypothetical protein